jgi:hypothetical protein
MSNIEKMIDELISHDPEEITRYVDEFRLKYSKLSQAKVAQKILDDQSARSSFLGAVTGLGGFITLPATVPFDSVKSLRIQSYIVCCFSYLYGYSLDRLELKTDLFLILSHSSFDQLKAFVCSEVEHQVKDNYSKQKALKRLHEQSQYKEVASRTSIQIGKKMGTKYASRLLMNVGEKTIKNHALREVPKVFRGVLWRVGGRKIAEKTLQKSLGKAVPLLGAVVGGGVDWWSTQSVGKVAIEYYESGGPDFLEGAYDLLRK